VRRAEERQSWHSGSPRRRGFCIISPSRIVHTEKPGVSKGGGRDKIPGLSWERFLHWQGGHKRLSMSSEVLDKHSHRWGGSKTLMNANSCSNLSDSTIIHKHNIIAPSNWDDSDSRSIIRNRELKRDRGSLSSVKSLDITAH
jgi:hypothetical protein